MYLLKVAGLGFIHKTWNEEEPRFCADQAKAKQWKTLEGALEFGNRKLSPRLPIRWELWQHLDGTVLPVMRPQSMI
jgi:hypothetical protein